MATTDSKPSFSTPKQVDGLKPKASAYEVPDKGAPGLRLRVYPTGRKVFRWVRPLGGGKTKAITLGEYGSEAGQLSLAEARARLDNLKAQHKDAIANGDPLTGADRATTVEDLARLFYANRIKPHRKRPEEALGVIERHIIKNMGKRKLAILQARAVSAMVVNIVEGGAPVQAGKVLAMTKQMLNFGVAMNLLSHNPAAGLRPIDLGAQDYTPGSRYLTVEEIRAFYFALGKAPRLSEQTKLAFKVLLLTGARTNELLAAPWREIDLDAGTWILQPERQKLTPRSAKKAQDFLIPLAPQAIELFAELKKIAGESPWVMASDSEEGHYSDKALGQALRRLFKLRFEDDQHFMRPLLPIPRFTPHDLRRTCRTHLTDTLDVQPHVAEKYLGHSLGTLERVYDKGQLLSQRLDAAKRWADYIDRITSERTNVVELPV